MSRREAWLSALLVFVAALAIRAAAASLIGFPRPEDTAYYVGVARNLVEGRGLVSDALWSFGTPPLHFPREAFEVWLPLPSLLEAIPIALSGARAPIPLETAFRAAQVVPVIVGGIVAVLAWRLAADVAAERGLPPGRARSLALGTGLTSAAYLPLVLHSALPDSTMLFAALALGACLLMSRVARDPGGVRLRDPRVVALGLLLGLAALTRNEAIWLALAWVLLVARIPADALGRRPGEARIRLVGVAGVVAALVFGPWAARDWLVFGTPLPGQAISNALSVTGFDIFAWHDQPTLARYLAVGPATLVGMRVDGFAHNLGNVLLLLGIPVAVLGLLSLPWQARDRVLRPLALLAGMTFLVSSLVFPVATTWGTFLHAAGPVHVLLVIAALGGLDALFDALGARLSWTRHVAWLGGLAGVSASLLFTAVLLPGVGDDAHGTQIAYQALRERMAAIGAPLDDSAPVIHDFPIWLAETARVRTLALPDEEPRDVVDLAETFGAKWLITADPEHGAWPAVLDGSDLWAACFTEVDLGRPSDPGIAQALEGVRVFRIGCPKTLTPP